MNIKPKHKLLAVVLIIGIGMAYENSRDNPPAPTAGSTTYTRLGDLSLTERIEIYEAGLVSDITGDYKRVPSRGWIHESAYRGNLVARAGRNIGDGIQNFVRESLRGIFRFFDGVIS